MAEMITLTRARKPEEQKYGQGDISIQVDKNFDREQAIKDGFTNLPPISVSSPNNPVSSSEDIRSNIALTKARANEIGAQLDALSSLTGDVLNSGTYTQTQQGQQNLADLEAARKAIGTLSAADEQKITEAGVLEGRKYDPLIAEAEARRRDGLPKDIINAGERGGFLNTQFAGRAALQSTNGGNFIGAGGELENIASAYDRNIQDIKAKKDAAIAEAEAAKRKALLTGQEDDYNRLVEAYDRAVKAHKEGVDLQVEKVNAIQKYESILQSRAETNQKIQKQAFDKITDLSKSGVKLDTFAPEELDRLEEEAGLPYGTIDEIFSTSEAARNAKTEEDRLDAAIKITTLLQKYPLGQDVQIGDSVYKGLGDNGDTRTYSETDNAGNVTFITIDSRTGRVIGTASGGRVGKRSTEGGGTATERLSGEFASALETLNANFDHGGAGLKFVNTDVYAKLADKFRSKGELSKFIANFPPEEYLDPNDPRALKYLQTATQAQPDKKSKLPGFADL